MTESHRQLNYQGIFTYQIGEQVSSFRISHTVRDGKEFESLESLDGEQRDLVRQGHDVHCVHPGPELIRLKVAGDPGVEYSYIVDMEGHQRVAGRNAVSLAIRPRDTHRLGYRLALDEQTGLLLRSDIISQQGKMLERFQYVMLELEDTPVAASAGQTTQTHNKLDVAFDDAGAMVMPWKPSWMPPGFTLVPTPESATDSGQSYTDGLAVLSIFVESLDTSIVREGSMRRGASVSYTTPYPDYSKLVTVVGEVPMSTAKRVAESIRWGDVASSQQVLQ